MAVEGTIAPCAAGGRVDVQAEGRPRRLLMVEQGGRGGEADYTGQLTAALAQQGWQVELATAADHLYPTAPGVRIAPVFHYVRGHSRPARMLRSCGLGWVGNGLRFVFAMPRLVRLARRADVVHVQGWEHPLLGVLAVLALRSSAATIVETWHNTFYRERSLARFNPMLRRLLATLTARTIVHTQADLARIPAEVVSRTVVIPHGDYGALARAGGHADRAAARAALRIAADAHLALMFGQLRRDKGLDDLIAAAERVPSLTLLIGGEDLGALAANRERLAALEREGRVVVREGFLAIEQAAQLFAAADVVVLPYAVASQSGVLLLAYGFARPVIVYPVGGLPEAVRDGQTGWICARSDPAALADALQASAAAGWAECRRRGEAGAMLAQERFAWEAIARKTGELYGELLARRNR